MMATIMQWNCRGLYHHFEQLKLLLQQYNPAVLCLQETKLKAEQEILGLCNFSKYKKNYTQGIIASGGVALLVRNDIIQSELELNTPLQAVAARVTLNGKAISIISIYLHPD